jgi:protoporphyrinogen/coproporphyrinogen III oxidase
MRLFGGLYRGSRFGQGSMNSSETRRIAVIGGGISGLAATLKLHELAPGSQVTLFEAGQRLGGVLSTVERDGFQVEQSADNFITTVPWALELCQQLGLADQLVQTNSNCRRTFVVCRGRLCRLPDGFLMMAPTQMWPLAVTPILSLLGKVRAAMEYFIPPRKDDADESMAQFVRRRLGRETFDRLIEPLISSIYAADMEKLSVKATLSRFREMEKQHGSLIRAMRHQMKHRPNGKGESGARYSMFVTLSQGLSKLVDAIVARLPAESIRLNTSIERIERVGNAWRVWPVARGQSTGNPADEGAALEFDAVILAIPAYQAKNLLSKVDSQLAAELEQIEYSGTAIVSLGYKVQDVGHPLDGMGAVVPAVENSPILACSFSSQKYPHRAPEGRTLLRVFVGGARRPELAEMPGNELLPLVLEHLRPLLRIRGEPVFCDIANWPRTMPQYHVGHLERVARIEGRLALLPGLKMAGSAFRGVGVPDCINSGQRAAEQILGVGKSADV